MKPVRERLRTVSDDACLDVIQQLAGKNVLQVVKFERGKPLDHYCETCTRADYVEHLPAYIDTARLKPRKLVVRAGATTVGLRWVCWKSCCRLELLETAISPARTLPAVFPIPPWWKASAHRAISK